MSRPQIEKVCVKYNFGTGPGLVIEVISVAFLGGVMIPYSGGLVY